MSCWSGDLELAVGYLKSIVESCRCPICDTNTGGRLRYDCGHVACTDCVEVAPACQLCTPPRGTGSLEHDERLTCRVLHVGELVKSFREAYNIDVLKSSRISDQQKVERSLFPQCIQAPQTYSNQRKSFATPRKSKGKENISVLPGELISAAITMDNSENYVQKWLDQHDDDFKTYQPRKPFADLSVNSPKLNNTLLKKQTLFLKENLQTPSKSAKKRPFRTVLSGTRSQSILDKCLKESNKSNVAGAKRLKKEFAKLQEDDRAREYSVKTFKKNEKDESGIELDDDPIVIDDSEVVVDKDKAAWLAVLEADKIQSTPKSTFSKHKPQIKYHERISVFSPKVLNWMNSDTNDYKTASIVRKPWKVPFYKKAPINEQCKFCYNTLLKNNNVAALTKDKNVSIIVETSNIITKITVNNSVKNAHKKVKSNSQAIQTELCKASSDINKQTNIKLLESEDMFTMENKEMSIKKNKDTAKINSESLCLPEPDKIVTNDVSDIGKAIESTEESPIRIELKKHEPEPIIEIPIKLTKTAVNFKDKERERAVLLLDSSSDSEHEKSGNITVTADVHRSHEESDIQGVLREISLREIRVPQTLKRGITPTSTDSSDKENRDPNTKRRRRDGKKSRKKTSLKLT